MSRTFFLVAAAMLLAAAVADDAGSYGLSQCEDPSPSSSTFRADILALLDAIPAAAAPTGFAALQPSSGSGSSAFARGLCLGAAGGGGPCAECLAGAARKAADCAGSGSRRGSVWSWSPTYCSLNFGDTNGTSPVEAAYRACQLFVSTDAGGHLRDVGARGLGALALSLARRSANSTSGEMLATEDTDMAAAGSQKKARVQALAQCARDRAPADCATCLRLSAQHLPKCWGPRDEGLAAAAVSVVAYDCYLRLELAPPVYQESPFCM